MVPKNILHPTSSTKHTINHLPNSGDAGPVVTPGEVRTRIAKINQTSIVHKLSKLFGVNDVHKLPAFYLLMGSYNVIEVTSNKRRNAL